MLWTVKNVPFLWSTVTYCVCSRKPLYPCLAIKKTIENGYGRLNMGKRECKMSVPVHAGLQMQNTIQDFPISIFCEWMHFAQDWKQIKNDEANKKQIIFAEARHPSEIIIRIGNSFCHFYVISPLFSHGVWVLLPIPPYPFVCYFSQFTLKLSAAYLLNCFLRKVKNDLWRRENPNKRFLYVLKLKQLFQVEKPD